jgi:hypothetical protein
MMQRKTSFFIVKIHNLDKTLHHDASYPNWKMAMVCKAGQLMLLT